MSQKRPDDSTQDPRPDFRQVKGSVAMTRREWIQASAATGAALVLNAEAGKAAVTADLPLHVGTGKRIITPNPLLPVSGGMGPTRPTREKRGELTARAIYLRRGDVGVGIVSLDLLGFPSILGDRVRARVPRLTNANILIGSTHTHSAPDCYAFPDGQGGHTGDLAFMDRVCVLAAEALNEAIDAVQPARLRIATGE